MEQLFADLKQATAEAHRKLDSHPCLAQLMQRNLSLESYRQTLLKLYPAHAQLEVQVSSYWQANNYPYCPIPRTHLLQAELQNLGCRDTALDPQCSITGALPTLTSLSAAIGASYVLEGSRLGGMVLKRTITKRLPSHHCLFFADDGVVHWQHFQGFCEKQSRAIDHFIAVRAAQQSFASYYNVIDEHVIEGVV